MSDVVITGVGWRSFSTILQFVMSIMLTIFFMQYISPEGYGIIAKLLIILGLINIFIDLGYSQSIVQQKAEDSESLSTHFFWILAVSTTLATVIFGSSDWISKVYQQEELRSLLRLFSITIVLGGSIIVHRALLHRKMDFRKLAIIELSSFVISGILGVILVVQGYDYMAVVYQLLCASVLQFALFWASRHFLPIFSFQWSRLRTTRGFSIYVFISMITDYAVLLLDQFLISVYFPAAVLGHYNRASSLMKSPVSLVPGTISQVLFPYFSRLRNDSGRDSESNISAIYLKTHSTIIFIFVPIFVSCFILADSIVTVLFPDSWLPMVPYFRLLALIACIAVTMIEGSVFLSYGKADRFFFVSLPGKLLIILSVIVGVIYGIETMLWGILAGTLVSKGLSLFALHRFFNISFREFISSLLPLILPLICFILFLLGMKYLTEIMWLQLILAVTVYIVIVSTFYRFGQDTIYDNMRQLVSRIQK